MMIGVSGRDILNGEAYAANNAPPVAGCDDILCQLQSNKTNEILNIKSQPFLTKNAVSLTT